MLREDTPERSSGAEPREQCLQRVPAPLGASRAAPPLHLTRLGTGRSLAKPSLSPRFTLKLELRASSASRFQCLEASIKRFDLPSTPGASVLIPIMGRGTGWTEGAPRRHFAPRRPAPLRAPARPCPRRPPLAAPVPLGLLPSVKLPGSPQGEAGGQQQPQRELHGRRGSPPRRPGTAPLRGRGAGAGP